MPSRILRYALCAVLVLQHPPFRAWNHQAFYGMRRTGRRALAIPGRTPRFHDMIAPAPNQLVLANLLLIHYHV